MALCCPGPVLCTLRRRHSSMTRMVMAMSTSSTALQIPLASSREIISFSEVHRNLQSVKKNGKNQMETDLPGFTVQGTLSHEARVYKQPAMGLLTTLQDEQDSSLNIKLLINNFTVASTTDNEARAWFPRGARVRIVEPRVLLAGPVGFAMLVDNPASLEIVSIETSTEVKSGNACWTAANSALKSGEFVRAAHLYEGCIELGFPGVLQANSRAAEAWLNMGFIEKAYIAANKALTQNPSHLHSLFVKAEALQQMQEYKLASETFLEAENTTSDVEDRKRASESRRKCAVLHEQSTTGLCDLSGFLLHGRSPSMAPECSDFIGKVRLGSSHGKGRGLFATEDLKVGELVLISNSITRSSKGGEEFHARIGRACAMNRRILAQLTAFFDEQDYFDMDLFRPSSGWFWKCMDHSHPSSSYRYVFTDLGRRNGLCPLATMINHSCLPNVSRQPVGGALFVRASRDISKGEELLACYFDPFAPLSHRRKQSAERNFKFVCSCPRCRLEERIEREKPGIGERYFAALKNTQDAGSSLAELMKLSSELDSVVEDEKSRSWLVSSFPYAYWADAYISGKTKAEKEAKIEGLVRAFHETAPGGLTTLFKMVEMCSPGGHAVRGGPSYSTEGVKELLRREAICCFGEQREDVLQAVIRTPTNTAAGDLSF